MGYCPKQTHKYWQVKMWEFGQLSTKKGKKQNAYLKAMSYISKYKGCPSEKIL